MDNSPKYNRPQIMDVGTNTNNKENSNVNMNVGQKDTVTIPVSLTITSTQPTAAGATQAVLVASPPVGPPQTVSAPSVPNLITVPVPIVHNEDEYVYVMVKGSLHDRSCSVFGLNDEERQALTKRFESVKPVVNGVMVSISPVDMVNTLAQLNYRVICASGEAEICWTMQREI